MWLAIGSHFVSIYGTLPVQYSFPPHLLLWNGGVFVVSYATKLEKSELRLSYVSQVGHLNLDLVHGGWIKMGK